jgi:recombinational DNA repair ATPase RecF
MKIVQMTIENIMKIKAAFIKPSDDVVLIQGDNEAGKSSILDAIIMAFKGDRALPDMPIKKGAKKGEIVINIDGNDTIPPFTITRTITAKNAYIKIEPVEVLHGETPRSFLDKIIGSISFDPLDFINQEGKKQRQVILELIGVDIDALDKREKDAFDLRAAKNKEVRQSESKLSAMKQWHDVKETVEIKIADISKKLTQAINEERSIKIRIEANDRLKKEGIALQDRIDETKRQLEIMEGDLLDKKEKFRAERKLLESISVPDIDALNAEMQSIDALNNKIRDNANYKNERDRFDSLSFEGEQLDAALESIRNERIEILKSSPMPIAGLTFDEDGLYYNDIPLSQCSDGAKLMIGTAISMALNPTMKVLRIKDGSLLGPKNMSLLNDLVKEKGYQCWVERVMDQDQFNQSGKVGIFIEEGEIQMIDGVEVEEKITAPKSTPVNRKTEPINQVQQDEEDW